jgi:hypothetical protein
LPVSSPEQNPDALFAQAQSAEDAGDIAGAERLYRVLMRSDPTDAAPPFIAGWQRWRHGNDELELGRLHDLHLPSSRP